MVAATLSAAGPPSVREAQKFIEGAEARLPRREGTRLPEEQLIASSLETLLIRKN
jgi:hypothetical protein